MYKDKQCLKRLLACILTCALILIGLPFGQVSSVKAEPEDGLILHYDFNMLNENATIVSDCSGNQNSGEIKCVGREMEGTYSIKDVNIYGRPSKALELSGGVAGPYLQFPKGVLGGYDTVTISIWVKLFANNGYQRIWDFGTGQDNYIYLMSDGRNAGFQGYAAAITTGGWTNEKGIQKKDNLDKRRWVLTTVVIDGTRMSLYENGRQIGKTVDTGIALKDLGETTNNYIGYGQFGDNPTYGQFADVRIYNRALEPEEIQSMYFVDETGIVSGDLAGLDLGDTSGITSDIELPSSGENGSEIQWKSENKAISIHGDTAKVVRPRQGEADSEGQLIAELRYQGISQTKQFDVTVLAEYTEKQMVEHDTAALQEMLGEFLPVLEDIELPTRGDWGSSITWQSKNKAIKIVDGIAKVTRPGIGEEQSDGALIASISSGKEEQTITFEAAVPSLRKSAAIKEIEEIQVETLVGNSPSLPNHVRVTYKDGSVRKLKTVWPEWIDGDMYSSTGSFTVEGRLVGEKNTITANVNVLEEEKPRQAITENFPLHSITLDQIGQNGSILTQNRERACNYLELIDSQRMLYNFYQTYGQKEKIDNVKPLGGWEEPEGLLRGHCTGFYLSALSYAYASTGEEGLKSKLDGMVHELRQLQKLCKGEASSFETEGIDQTLWSKDPSVWGEGFLSAYPPDQFALLEKYNTYPLVWAPYYVMHKLLEGLIDAYRFTGNEEALESAKALGKWAFHRLGGCEKEQLTKMWGSGISGEYGGMNESMAQLYLYTGDPEFLEGAKLFDNTRFFNNMVKNVDSIAGFCVSQHIAQAIGALKIYEATEAMGKPEMEYYHIAENFWNMVVSRYSFSTGSVGNGTTFQEPYQQAKSITGHDGCETCAVSYMLNLTKMLHNYNPDDAGYMDYYERALYNHILASQTPNNTSNRHNGTTRMIFVSPNAQKTFGDDDTGFSCCYGTGMVNHVKYQEAAYSKTEDTLYVGLYLPSTVKWEEKGVTVVQETEFPSETTKFTVSSLDGSIPSSFQMKLRVPYWATKGFTVKINGEQIEANPEISAYLALEDIQAGDVIEVTMPWGIHLDRTPDLIGDSIVASVMYGPFVMAGRKLGDGWRTLLLSEILEESFQASKHAANGFPVLTSGEITFLPMFAPEFASEPYHAYFKIVMSLGDGNPWHEASLINTTPQNGMFILSTEMIKDGGELIVTAYPNEGYQVKDLFINGTRVLMGDDNTYTLKHVEENVTIIGNFRLQNAKVPDPGHLEYRANVYSDYTASWENLNGIKVNWEPESSNQECTGLGWGNYFQMPGSEHFVQYEWDIAVQLNKFEIYWYDDAWGTRIPASIEVLYLDRDGTWQKADVLTPYEDSVKVDQYNTIRLPSLETTAVRLVMTVLEGAGATGIYRWKVSYEKQEDIHPEENPK